MGDHVEEVAAELAHLERNRGLQTGDLSGHVGPRLAQLTGFSAARGDTARQSLMRQLVRATQDLPPDLRFVFLRACATRPDDPPTLQRRLESGAAVIDRSPRVARRRLDEANALVAAKLVASADDAGWFLGALRASVDFREPQPVYRATHTLVVTSPALSRVSEKISLPGVGTDVTPEFAVSGHARHESARRIHQQTWEFWLELDRTYVCGELVEYHTALRLDRRRDAPPMSVMAPRRDCWKFSTTVNLGGLADQVWILDGVTPPTVTDEEPSGPLIDPESEPVPTAEFANLTPGLVYGLRWRWKDPASL